MQRGRDAAVRAFLEVRELPYAIDAAHAADDLQRVGTGDCLAKAELLARRLTALGLRTRLVRCRYELPAVVPEVAALPSRLDLHRAVEVFLDDRWLLADATHDSGLAGTGLTVADWDGLSSTEPAYPPIGPTLVEGVDDLEIDAALNEIREWTRQCHTEDLQRWRWAYIDWLAHQRPSGT